MSLLSNEHEFEVSIPQSHELALREPGEAKPGEAPYRTRAYLALKQFLGEHLFPLCETTSVSHENKPVLSYNILIRGNEEQVTDFRNKAAELGLSIREGINGSKRGV